MSITRHPRRPLAAAALAVTTVLGLAAPASAQVVVVPDATGDNTATGRDLTSIRIDHRPNRVFFAVHYVVEEGWGMPRNLHVWVDTGGTAAPDRLVGVYGEVEPELFVYRTSRFGREGKQLCRLRNSSADGEHGVTTFNVPRSCLGDPKRLRVNLRTWNELGSEDFAPAVRTFGPWVRRGAA